MDLHIRIRIDREIAEKAVEMARARGKELPDVIRLMLNKAVRQGDFAIDEGPAPPLLAAEPQAPYYVYQDRQWDGSKEVLDAELALGLLNQYIASHSLQIEDLIDQGADADQIKQLRDKRDEARRQLASLDPSDEQAVRAVLNRLAPGLVDSDPRSGDIP